MIREVLREAVEPKMTALIEEARKSYRFGCCGRSFVTDCGSGENPFTTHY